MEISVSQRLKALREEHEWTHAYLSEKTGIEPDRLRYLEDGTVIPEPVEAKKLCDLFEVSFFYLMDLTDERNLQDQDFQSLITGMPVPDLLTVLRYSSGWTVDDLAGMARIRSDRLLGYESGEKNVTPAVARKLASLYNIPDSCLCATAPQAGNALPKPAAKPQREDSCLKRLRMQHGYSLAQAARHLGISRGLLSFYEIGQARVTDQRAAQFAELYHVSPEELRKQIDQDYEVLLSSSRQSSSDTKNERLRQLRLERFLVMKDDAGADSGSISPSAAEHEERSSPEPAAEHKTAPSDIPAVSQMSDTPQGTYLLSLRLQKEWTLDQAAERIGIDTDTLSGLESGRQKLTAALLQKCAEAYGVPVEAVTGSDMYPLVQALRSSPDLMELFRLCLDDPSRVKKCLDILKADMP